MQLVYYFPTAGDIGHRYGGEGIEAADAFSSAIRSATTTSTTAEDIVLESDSSFDLTYPWGHTEDAGNAVPLSSVKVAPDSENAQEFEDLFDCLINDIVADEETFFKSAVDTSGSKNSYYWSTDFIEPVEWPFSDNMIDIRT